MIRALALAVPLAAALGGCTTSPRTGQPVPWYSCESAITLSAACVKEAQGRSVHDDHYVVQVPPAHPAGTFGEWTYTGVALYPAGTFLPVLIVHRPCGSPSALTLGCVNLLRRRIEVVSTVPQDCVAKIVAHELDGHVAGGTHGPLHREHC